MAATVSYIRDDIVVAAPSGDCGMPRPCLVVQSNLFSELPSLTICPLTSDVRADVPLLRITVEPEPSNGLEKFSQIAIDKITTLPASRISRKIGTISDTTQLQVTRSLAVFLGIG
jgi:mRNA interferase MazF